MTAKAKEAVSEIEEKFGSRNGFSVTDTLSGGALVSFSEGNVSWLMDVDKNGKVTVAQSKSPPHGSQAAFAMVESATRKQLRSLVQ